VNVAAFIGHSDIRVATMGLRRAVDAHERPTPSELDRMSRMLEDALDAGFVGLSTIRSSFSKLEGVRYPARQLPSTYATWGEYRKLNSVLRRRNRVHQSTPDLASRAEVGLFFAQSAGRVFRRRALKTTLISAADIKADRNLVRAATTAAHLANKLGGADFRWQHLPVPFEVYADGIDLVIFEELGSGAAALNLRDEIARARLLADEEYRRWFRKDIAKRFGMRIWHRDLYDIDPCGGIGSHHGGLWRRCELPGQHLRRGDADRQQCGPGAGGEFGRRQRRLGGLHRRRRRLGGRRYGDVRSEESGPRSERRVRSYDARARTATFHAADGFAASAYEA